MLYLVPPAGAPVKLSDIVRAIGSRLFSPWSAGDFGQAIKAETGARYCYFFNLGRTALLYALRAVSELVGSFRNEIIIPAYTCRSVADAITMAGLRIRLVDIDPMTMDYDYDKLARADFSRVAAMIGCNLFAIVSNWNNLNRIAREKQVFLIDDAAQSIGSRYGDCESGCLGDVGFYSLGRGKNLSTYSGGILLTDNERIARHVETGIQLLAQPGSKQEIKALVAMTLYSFFLKPGLYWIPSMMPTLHLGDDVAIDFPDRFSPGRLTPFQQHAGAILYRRLDDLNAIRAANARKLGRAIKRNSCIQIPGFDENNCPSFLRLPLLMPDQRLRDNALVSLRRLGIQASTMYTSTIYQISGIGEHLASNETEYPGALDLVRRLLTLPTHPYMKEKHMRMAVSCLTGATMPEDEENAR